METAVFTDISSMEQEQADVVAERELREIGLWQFARNAKDLLEKFLSPATDKAMDPCIKSRIIAMLHFRCVLGKSVLPADPFLLVRVDKGWALRSPHLPNPYLENPRSLRKTLSDLRQSRGERFFVCDDSNLADLEWAAIADLLRMALL